jgi:hypothetical protein
MQSPSGAGNGVSGAASIKAQIIAQQQNKTGPA